jgi:hypothetical protein
VGSAYVNKIYTTSPLRTQTTTTQPASLRTPSEHQHLIGGDSPLAQQIHIAGLYPLDQSFWLEPASL